MSSKNQTSKIYVDLESLLDIRQGYLYNKVKDKKALGEYLVSHEYNFRTSDKFSIYEEGNYREEVKTAGFELIKASMVTYCISAIDNKATNAQKRASLKNEQSDPEIIINTYPFKLSEAIMTDIRDGVFKKLSSPCLIDVVYMTPSELSPFVINNSNFVACFIYDFSSWISEHGAKLENERVGNCSMHFPQIRVNTPTEQQLKDIRSTGFKDEFSYLEFVTSGSLDINFMPIVFYSNAVVAIGYIQESENFEPPKTEEEMKIDEEVDEAVKANIDKYLSDLEDEDGYFSTEV